MTQESPITIQGPVESACAAQVCNAILHSLPEWFGIESAIVQYVEDVKTLPTWIAISGDTPIGFISIKKHFPQSAEVIVMGVMPEYHHQGVGRRLLAAAESALRETGVEYLQVKTLDASRCCEEYVRTRAFYEAMGFRPLEVFPELWDKDNPCLLMVKRL